MDSLQNWVFTKWACWRRTKRLNPSIKFKILKATYLDHRVTKHLKHQGTKAGERFLLLHSQEVRPSASEPYIRSGCSSSWDQSIHHWLIAPMLGIRSANVQWTCQHSRALLPPSLISGVYLSIYCSISPFTYSLSSLTRTTTVLNARIPQVVFSKRLRIFCSVILW